MDKIIFYRKFDKPIEWVDNIGGKEIPRRKDGEFYVRDERVEKFYLIGSLSPTDLTPQLSAELVFKNGFTINFKTKDNSSTAWEGLVDQAEEYLLGLPNDVGQPYGSVVVKHGDLFKMGSETYLVDIPGKDQITLRQVDKLNHIHIHVFKKATK